MAADQIADLERRMAEAAAGEDYELAARLRDQLATVRAAPDQTAFERQVPGRMGLGTDQQVFRPPAGWTAPKKPNPMTANTKPRGGRKS